MRSASLNRQRQFGIKIVPHFYQVLMYCIAPEKPSTHFKAAVIPDH